MVCGESEREGKVATVSTTDKDVTGGMVYYKNLKIKDDLTLPLRTNPTRFAVMRRDGMSSNTWGVYVENKGEVYIACRDHMKPQKISLHKSGKRHIAFPPDFEPTKGNRFLDEWWDPQCLNVLSQNGYHEVSRNKRFIVMRDDSVNWGGPNIQEAMILVPNTDVIASDLIEIISHKSGLSPDQFT